MDEILEILVNDARLTSSEIAKMTKKTEKEVQKIIKQYEQDGTILQYKTIVNPEQAETDVNIVRALIEVSILPQKNVGFDAVAERIYQFDEVKSCTLLSGSYDLLLEVEGANIQTVAEFVSSKLSPMDGVRQTTTHFLLKKYKEAGRIFKQASRQKRPNISY